MPQATEDRVARLIADAKPRGLLETIGAEDLIYEILEAGLRANPRLADRLQHHYQEEDERHRLDGIQDAKNIIKSLSERLGRDAPNDLDAMTPEELNKLHETLFHDWYQKNEGDKRLVQRLQRELGPLVRVKLTRSIVAPEALAQDAKRLWLEGIDASDLEASLTVEQEPGLTYDQVDERLYKEHIQPILDDHAAKERP